MPNRRPLCVLTADTHLAQRAWARRPDLCGDSYYGFEQVVDYCVQAHLPLVLAGDVFDKTRPDPNTIWVTRQQLERMRVRNLPVWYIQGQHELDRNMPWLKSVLGWTSHINKTTLDLNGITLYGLDWTPPDVVRAEFDLIPADTNVLVAHQVWKGFMGNFNKHECDFDDVPHVQLIATGDYHRTLTLRARNKSGDSCAVLSPGPPAMQSIDEHPEKCFFVLNDDLSLERIPLRARNMYRFVIGSEADLEKFLDEDHLQLALTPQDGVPENISKNILQVVYQNDVPEAYQRITAVIGQRAHLFMTAVRNRPEVMNIEKEARLAAVSGLEGNLELLVQKDTPLYRDVMTMLCSRDPATQIMAMREAFEQAYIARSVPDESSQPISIDTA